MITIIAAITRHGGLGRDGDMLFHISEDLRRFKSLTMGHPLVMGRRTFESFPKGPLPGRRNCVVTRNAAYCHDGIETYPSLAAALEAAPDAMVIGGGQIYAQAMPLADVLEITEIDADDAGADTWFPAIDPAAWVPAYISEWRTDPRSAARYRYLTYTRRTPPHGEPERHGEPRSFFSP